MEKITKKERFAEIKKIIEESGTVHAEELIAFVDKEVALLAAKAEKAAVRSAKKRAEGDELRETVLSMLTDKFQTIDEITDAIGEKDVTKARVTARLTQLVAADLAEKTLVKAGSRKLTAYKVAEAEADEVESEPVEE